MRNVTCRFHLSVIQPYSLYQAQNSFNRAVRNQHRSRRKESIEQSEHKADTQVVPIIDSPQLIQQGRENARPADICQPIEPQEIPAEETNLLSSSLASSIFREPSGENECIKSTSYILQFVSAQG